MHLHYAFLADAAQFTPDGKLWLLGGDFETLASSTFPAVHNAMVLVIRLRVRPTECGREHQVRVELIDSDGGRLRPEITLNFTPQVRPDQPHRDVPIGLALNFQQQAFPRPGDYSFHVLVDGFELGEVPLTVQAATPPRPGPSPS